MTPVAAWRATIASTGSFPEAAIATWKMDRKARMLIRNCIVAVGGRISELQAAVANVKSVGIKEGVDQH